MVSKKSIADQLKRIGFSQSAWGRAEVKELPNIIIPDEQIFECVNGMYEGGFALLIATDVRVILIDKKPFNYLTVEDLRFDMINEIDYNHRLFGAYVNISTGNRDLKFRSYNQARLRKLISHVQHCMAETKKKQVSHQEGQHQHLEQINGHLKTYLIAQHEHQQELQKKLQEVQEGGTVITSPEPPRPSPELSDYLLAQGLLSDYQDSIAREPLKSPAPSVKEVADTGTPQDDLYVEGLKEVFGDRSDNLVNEGAQAERPVQHTPLEVNPLRIAYSKLPTVLRNRKFGYPSLPVHIHVPRVSVPAPPEPTTQPIR